MEHLILKNGHIMSVVEVVTETRGYLITQDIFAPMDFLLINQIMTTGPLGSGGTTHIGDDEAVSTNMITFSAPEVDIAMGTSHSYAMLANGELQCWGSNSNGQLGLGATTNNLAPSASDLSFTP